MAAVVLSCAGVEKKFPAPGGSRGRRHALAGIDLKIREGERVVLLGPNGSGKSTLLRLALGLQHPDRGKVRLRGCDPRRARARRGIGYLPEGPPGDPQAPARESVRACARLAGAGRGMHAEAEELLAQVGLGKRGRAPWRSLSRGMRQRAALAAALAGNPTFLVLDEPFSGLDPEGRERVEDLLVSWQGEGRTLLLASHRWGRLERTADRVILLDEGVVGWEGSPAELVKVGAGGRPALAFAGRPERDRAREMIAAAGWQADPVEHGEESLQTLFRQVLRESGAGERKGS